MIYYSKNVKWLKPFVDAVKDSVPTNRIKSIRGYRVPLKLDQDGYAQITQYEGERKYCITLRIFDVERTPVTRRKKHTKTRCETILISLAHELAHLVYWEHTPEHFDYQARILQKFSKVLEKYKIKDHSTKNPDKFIALP